MKSMTGFGRGTAACENFDINAEASSVNRKSLEVSASLPKDCQGVERKISELAKEFFERGKIQISCSVSKRRGGAEVSDEIVKGEFLALKNLCAALGVEFKPDVDTVISIRKSASESAAGCVDTDAVWQSVRPAFYDAFKALEIMRKKEGEALKADLSKRIGILEGFAEQIEGLAAGRVERYRENLLSRLSQLGLNLDLNDERVLKEVCIFADKCDIAEEITRLKSHIGQFKTAVEENGAVGRKLDFICQELGREINTASSKANDLSLTKLTIDFKNELERVREQVQNVE